MFDISLYRAEIDDGLSEIISSGNRISIAGLAEPEINPRAYSEHFKEFLKAKSSTDEAIDLYPMKSLMVSVGSNLNLDVFLKEELWKARATPEDKPLNLDHSCQKIIGHITGCYAVDDDNNEISAKAALDDVPDSFHILASSVIYKHSEDEEWQKTISGVIGQINAGKRYVSMEALFANFDYILFPASAQWNEIEKAKIVERNKDTAFLTKHIKAFGGTGVYEKYKIGRVLRDFFFSALGVVLKPANPKSIIFDKNDKPLSKVNANSVQIFKSLGYLKNSGTSENEMPDNDMTNKITELTSKLEKAEATLREQADKQYENKIADLELKLGKANEVTVKLTEDNKTLVETVQSKATEIETVSKEFQAKIDETVAKLTETEAELNKTVAETKLSNRVSKIKEVYKVDDVSALAIANTFVKISDEEFAAHAELMAKTPTPTGVAPAPDKGGMQVPVSGPTIKTSAKADALDKVEEPVEGALAVASTDVGASQALNSKVAAYFKASKSTKVQKPKVKK